MIYFIYEMIDFWCTVLFLLFIVSLIALIFMSIIYAFMLAYDDILLWIEERKR